MTRIILSKDKTETGLIFLSAANILRLKGIEGLCVNVKLIDTNSDDCLDLGEAQDNCNIIVAGYPAMKLYYASLAEDKSILLEYRKPTARDFYNRFEIFLGTLNAGEMVCIMREYFTENQLKQCILENLSVEDMNSVRYTHIVAAMQQKEHENRIKNEESVQGEGKSDDNPF